MPRCLRTGTLLKLDPEIEKTAKHLRKLAKQAKIAEIQQEASPSSPSSHPSITPLTRVRRSYEHWTNIPLSDPSDSDTKSQVHEQPPNHNMDDNEDPPRRTIRSWGTQDITLEPSCINLPAAANFELKVGIINLLPTFHGMPSEDPHKHLKTFNIVTMSMKPNNVSEDAMKLRAFPHSLKDTAYDWFNYLEPDSIHNWREMAQAFLQKYFPEPKASNLRQQISGVKQGRGEQFHIYWERYKRLISKCPQHGMAQEQIISYFCKGLSPLDRRMLESSANGSYLNKTADEVRNLIELLAENSLHANEELEWDVSRDPSRRVNEVSTSKMEEQLSNLSKLVLQLVTLKEDPPLKETKPSTIGCGVCLSSDHPTDLCPTFQEEDEHANFVGGQFQAPQQAPGPYQAPQGFQRQGWKPAAPNANFRQERPQYQNQAFQRQPYQQPSNVPRQQEGSSKGQSLEDIVKALALNQQSFQDDTKNNFKSMEKQIIQLSSTINKMEERGRLPSQTEKNPNVSAITLRNGKDYEGPEMPKEKENAKEDEKEVEVSSPDEATSKKEKPPVIPKVTPPPFPSRLINQNKSKANKEIFDLFRKVELNIPLLDAITQVPRYAKFLKDLCTNKGKLKGDERINMGENVSAVLQKKLPPKCKDPGVFTIPCKLGKVSVSKAMLDLGASINVLPYSVYKTLGVGPLEPTGVVIQLADRSTVYPKGVLEDVLVQVNQLVFPADFYVLDMENDESKQSTLILLGRPFLKTSKTKIDVHSGTLSMEFDGEIIKFNIYDAMRFPSDVSSVNFVDINDNLSFEYFELENRDGEFALTTASSTLPHEKIISHSHLSIKCWNSSRESLTIIA